MISTLYEPFRHWSDGGSVWILSDMHFDDPDCKIMDPNWISPDEQVQIINMHVHKNDTFVILRKKFVVFCEGDTEYNYIKRPIIRQVSREIGVKVIYLFALPVERLIARYSEYGFQKLSDKDEEALHKRLKPSYDDSCIFMYKVI